MIERYFHIVIEAYVGYARYLWAEIVDPHWGNYVYWLIGVSLLFFALEVIVPWRKQQAKIRKDFWLDAFYMFFNFFLFSLVIYNAASDVVVNLFNDLLAQVGIRNLVAIEIWSWPVWVQLLTLFVIRDFLHWNVHRLLHIVPRLWEFHKVHHSVLELGFAAHLRFHWMENVVYKVLQAIPIALLGADYQAAFWVYVLGTVWGNFNHSNLNVSLGPLGYVFNNPRMHLWHHDISTEGGPFKNYGIVFSAWDFFFGTAFWPRDRSPAEIGYPGMEEMPGSFGGQETWPLSR